MSQTSEPELGVTGISFGFHPWSFRGHLRPTWGGAHLALGSSCFLVFLFEDWAVVHWTGLPHTLICPLPSVFHKNVGSLLLLPIRQGQESQLDTILSTPHSAPGSMQMLLKCFGSLNEKCPPGAHAFEHLVPGR